MVLVSWKHAVALRALPRVALRAWHDRALERGLAAWSAYAAPDVRRARIHAAATQWVLRGLGAAWSGWRAHAAQRAHVTIARAGTLDQRGPLVSSTLTLEPIAVGSCVARCETR